MRKYYSITMSNVKDYLFILTKLIYFLKLSLDQNLIMIHVNQILILKTTLTSKG
jgi:hypothetical protein